MDEEIIDELWKRLRKMILMADEENNVKKLSFFIDILWQVTLQAALESSTCLVPDTNKSIQQLQLAHSELQHEDISNSNSLEPTQFCLLGNTASAQV